MVPIRVGHVDLKGAVRPGASWHVFLSGFFEVVLPLVEVVCAQGEMITAWSGDDGVFAAADQVQLLKFAQPKPSAGEVERGPFHRLELKDISIKVAAFINVSDVKCHVI
mgnify:CR=1 FL=1